MLLEETSIIKKNNILMPRVLIVVGVLWADNGITAHLMTLSKRLIDAGCQVGLVAELSLEDSVTSKDSLLAVQHFENQGVTCFQVPFSMSGGILSKLSKSLKSLQALDQVIKEFKPNVMHVHSLATCPLLFPIRIAHRLPMVSSCHLEPDPQDIRPGIKFAAFFNAYLNNAFLGDRLIAVSSNLRDAFISLMNVPPEKVRLIHYGMETDHFRPPTQQEKKLAREFHNLQEQDHVICLLGRLSQVKGHDVLIEAIRILKSRGILVTALCAGKGYVDEEQLLQDQIQASGVGDLVKLLGFTDTRQVLWASDVKVLPSRREAAPLVIQEAMLCGVVTVRTPASGVKDQIQDGIDGFVVPFDDPQALADRLQNLFESPEQRKRMSAAAYHSAQEKFTAQGMLEKMLSTYQEVITERLS
jgi:glycosyltransferase involved in cell wall biosynthesis